MPMHGCVASGADAVPPPTTRLEFRPATREVINHVVDIRTNGGDVDLPLKVAGNAPPFGGAVHSYAWSIRVELKVGGLGRMSSYRGLLGWGGRQLSLGRDWRRDVLYDLVFLLRSRGLRWRSSNRVLPSREGLELGFRGTRRSQEPRPEGLSARSASMAGPERPAEYVFTRAVSVGLVRSACCLALAERERSRAEDPHACEVPFEASGSVWATAASRSSSA